MGFLGEMKPEILNFAELMQLQLDVNEPIKGSVLDFVDNNDFSTWLYEFEYHKAKLIASLMVKDQAVI